MRPGVQRASDVFRSGMSPVVLVCASREIALEAATTPPGTPVDRWEVLPPRSPQPTISPTSDVRATMTTDIPGAWTIRATAGGCFKTEWDIVLVHVRVAPGALIQTHQDYGDNGSGAFTTRFKSAVSDNVSPRKGNAAVSAEVEVLLEGGSPIDHDKVKVHVLQNADVDTLQGTYQSGATVDERIVRPAPRMGTSGPPVLDCLDALSDPPATPWLSPPDTSVVPQGGSKRRVSIFDSPDGSFLSRHTPPPGLAPTHPAGAPLSRVDGIIRFKTAIASVSDDAPNAITVHAEMSWTLDFAGSVGATGVYTPVGAQTTAASDFTPIDPGLDAGTAGFETFGPQFNRLATQGGAVSKVQSP